MLEALSSPKDWIQRPIRKTLYSRYGVVKSVYRVPHRCCAFVNFKAKGSAGIAMAAMQVRDKVTSKVIKVKGSGQGTRKPLSYRVSNDYSSVCNPPLCDICPVCFKCIHAVSI